LNRALAAAISSNFIRGKLRISRSSLTGVELVGWVSVECDWQGLRRVPPGFALIGPNREGWASRAPCSPSAHRGLLNCNLSRRLWRLCHGRPRECSSCVLFQQFGHAAERDCNRRSEPKGRGAA
jgi:hypothetical protein